MTAMVGGDDTDVGCCCLSAGSGGGVGVGGGVSMNGGGGMGGGVDMGVCARSAFAEEEDGMVVEEEGGGKRWTGGCFGLAWSE